MSFYAALLAAVVDLNRAVLTPVGVGVSCAAASLVIIGLLIWREVRHQ